MSVVNELKTHRAQECMKCSKQQMSENKNIDDQVLFSLNSSSSFDKDDEKSFRFERIIYTFDFDHGGQFISDLLSKPDNVVVSVTNLIASIVTYDENQKLTDYHWPIFGSGYRLLKQYLCHSFDPMAPYLMETTATLFVHEKDSKIGMILNNKVPASMKDAKYNATAVFTRKIWLQQVVNAMQKGIKMKG